MKILGIETSCDETAASMVNDRGEILSNIIYSQLVHHAPFGGVVPEIAARAHLEKIDEVVTQALHQANLTFAEVDAVAATAGPGLIGGVIAGLMTGKAIAAARNIPFLAINHLEGHALTARLTNKVSFPYLLLLISGGHTQILIVENVNLYQQLGKTLDDAMGEAFDKTAKMLGLDFPGGPSVEKMARIGKIGVFSLPRPLKGRIGCDFSFSGLKTAVRHAIQALPPSQIKSVDTSNLCAEFQLAVSDVVADRTQNAIDIFGKAFPSGKTLVAAGGVAANLELRKRLSILAEQNEMKFIAPPTHLCTDNGAMIAWAGIERLRLGFVDNLDFSPRPRWSLVSDPKKTGK